ncbi:glucose 1-dehydrogenase [Luteolibacter sp. GHJ8]|uniref:Glucose 1-dehydrogenase n=1 Tax=Luteolibacter rhizosphaerae TaxID=2989719 RepID=A0ABT3G9G3_9BACT|nr:glucose 1-dehydrogenase [Luteolibacter rhizosphaerae]MCW1916488.1 glucose 1-dehydrogenase [Luteolibacter rhizosphaerae]
MALTLKLAGKHAIVTGSSKGIGAAIAKALAAEGASVVVNYSASKDAADAVVASITAAGGKAIALQGNVAKPEDAAQLIADSVAAYGPIDILVNNAGVFDFKPLEAITPEHFHRLFDINVLGTILATQEALKHFNPAGGAIINTSSIVSMDSPAGTGVYNATKSAVDGLTRTFSKELGPRKIRVNSVNPGPIESDGVHAQGLLDTFIKLGEATALGRIGQPEDIGPGVVYLASDDAVWVTGTTLTISGGLK